MLSNNFFSNLSAKHDKPLPLLDGMTAEEKTQFVEKERALRSEKELRDLDATVEAQVQRAS